MCRHRNRHTCSYINSFFFFFIPLFFMGAVDEMKEMGGVYAFDKEGSPGKGHGIFKGHKNISR